MNRFATDIAHDIRTRRDIELLVNAFYAEVRRDPLLGDVFARRIGQGEWAQHEARICDFWETVLLGTTSQTRFKSRSLLRHLDVDEICPLCPHHFNRWCELFGRAVNGNFAGERADRAVCRARAMSEALQNQLERGRGCPLALLQS